MQRQTSSAHADLIAAATGAADDLLLILENIIRKEVFHSARDWQSASQFRKRARQELAIYEETPNFFRAEIVYQGARFRILQAEHAFSDLMSQTGNLEAITLAEATLREAEAGEQSTRAAFGCELASY